METSTHTKASTDSGIQDSHNSNLDTEDVAKGWPTQNTYGYRRPTQSGKIPFTPPGSDLKCETAYWLWGDLNTDTKPLIILHGGPGAPGRDWRPVTLLHQRRGIPVILYDQIGCGESTHLRSRRGDTSFWTDELFLAELENVKKHFNIQQFDLLGHSCGGMLAVLYALTQPPGLRKLIISSAPASDALRIGALLEQRAALPSELRDAAEAFDESGGKADTSTFQAAQAELARRHLCRLSPWPLEMQQTDALMNEDDTVTYSLYGGLPAKPTGPRKDYNVTPRLHEITETTVPGGVLLTNGRYDMSQDSVMRPFFERIRARVKWVRFAQSSHMAQLEEPEEFSDALGGFLTMA